MSPPSALTVLGTHSAQAIRLLRDDLETIFGARLISLVLYGHHVPGTPGAPVATGADAEAAADSPIHTLALVAALEYADLAACATRAEGWDAAGLAMPLLLSPDEFSSSLDTFPLEYGAIIARHLAITGDDPFNGITVRADDRRRACEVQAKSHLIHLREGFLEAEGRGATLARLIDVSIDSFATVLGNLAELDRATHHSRAALAQFAATRVGLSESLVARLLALPDRPRLSPDEASQLYPPYLDASARLARFADAWKETPPA